MAYREAQVGCTPDMAKGSARMLAMLKTRAQEKGRKGRTDPEVLPIAGSRGYE